MQWIHRFWPVCVALLLTALLYLPGLHGAYTFDDFPNIVDNAALHVSTLDSSAWLQAMWASPSSDLQRPLASLSFALNHYFAGLDPLPMKAANLLIHLFNGALLFALLRGVVRAGQNADGSHEAIGLRSREWLPLLVTAAWLLHPINLTAVLYVVQRMESLAQLFVLLGLLLYVDARKRQDDGRKGAALRLWIGTPLCTLLGVTAKESAVLLPLFALVLEFTVFRTWQRRRIELAAYYSAFLLVPGFLGLLWVLSSNSTTDAYAGRAFTLTQRLLTEPRVLLDYATWILLPLPHFFSFYRDDYPFSTDLWHPWSTLPAIALLVAMVVAAVVQRRRRPLVSLGLLWFLTAHLMTATFLPLELVFEHRNYFASAGLLLAAFDLLLPSPIRSSEFGLVRATAICSVIALCAITLAVRAREWSNPVWLAVAEAARHPHSPRATYDLGRTLVILSGYRPDSVLIPEAIKALEAAAVVPRASILPEVALVMVASRTGRPVQPQWWDAMRTKLLARHSTVEDTSAIKSLTQCQREGLCALDDRRMLETYVAALAHERPDPSIVYSYAIFAFNRLQDHELALRLARDAARARDPQYRLNLIGLLIDLGRFSDARAELAELERSTRPGSMNAAIANVQNRLRDVDRPTANPAGDSVPADR